MSNKRNSKCPDTTRIIAKAFNMLILSDKTLSIVTLYFKQNLNKNFTGNANFTVILLIKIEREENEHCRIFSKKT